MRKPLRYRLLHRLRRLLGARGGDDFDWYLDDYEYGRELEEVEKRWTTVLAPGEYAMEGGARVRRTTGRKPLVGRARLLYETVLLLRPHKVVEFGCGGGDHLHNLKVLDPGLDLVGLDRAAGQVALLRRRHPALAATVLAHDISRPLPDTARDADLAYVRAVIMHIHTGTNHLDALENVFAAAREHVVLQQNWSRHAYLDDIRRLADDGRIPWDDLHVHYRIDPEDGRPLTMVCSRTPRPEFPVLEDYAVLRRAFDA